ncbi:hypothetical protein [Thiomicrospira cyclica]|uniref:Lipoprotein n=1 Tax=Thiomicrospira cyclica (strain DSM 14477 / JCM 11371 / ALM1) TaxID=717773 RepID=F6DD23_THICA|nr:hypothetical protein [Thiomicrospira cyclica]AEG31759.1 hypothetical protein Thicy_0992 [Thiomicrospira cyclica ALM1]
MRNKFTLSLLFAPILVVSGCLGGGGDGGTDSLSITGVAIDGYLGQATVCLDLNRNMVCDDNEPRAITAADGTYTITGVTQAQINSFPVVVEAIAGTTTDTDLNGDLIPRSFSLTSPPGQGAVVSPLTSLAGLKVHDGFRLEDAQTMVAGLVFNDSSIDNRNNIIGDFIVSGNIQAHVAAQSLVRLQARLKDQLKDKITNEEDQQYLTSSVNELVLSQSKGFLGLIKKISNESRPTIDEIQIIVDQASLTLVEGLNVDDLIADQKNRIEIRSRVSEVLFEQLLSDYGNGDGIFQVWYDGSGHTVRKVSFFPEDNFSGSVFTRDCTINGLDGCIQLDQPVRKDDTNDYDYEVESNLFKVKVDGADRILHKVARFNSYDLSGLQTTLGGLDPAAKSFNENIHAKEINFSEGAKRIDFMWRSMIGPDLNDQNASYEKICDNKESSWYQCEDAAENDHTFDNETNVIGHKMLLPKEGTKGEAANNNLIWFSEDLQTIFYCDRNTNNTCKSDTTKSVKSHFVEGKSFISYLDMGPYLRDGRFVAQIFTEHNNKLYWFERDWFLVEFINPFSFFNDIAIKDLLEQVVE